MARGLHIKTLMARLQSEINCPLFQSRELTIRELMSAISDERMGSERVRKAIRLDEEAETLLVCERRDTRNRDCRNCGAVAALRKWDAELTVRGQALEGDPSFQ